VSRITSIEVGFGVSKDSKVEVPTADSIWDDEGEPKKMFSNSPLKIFVIDTKSFYENLPDLRPIIPSILLGDPESKEKKPPVGKVEASPIKDEKEKEKEKEKEVCKRRNYRVGKLMQEKKG